MRAVLCKELGMPESLVLEEVPGLIPGPGQVLISVQACGVNFPDTLIIQGKYQFKPESRNEGFKLFSMMSQEHDVNDSGKCTSYGRWHVPSQGCGYAIASAPSVFDVYKWAYNWNDLCDVVVSPVTGDTVTREIIQSGLGYKVKHNMLVTEMSRLMAPPNVPFWKKFLCLT